MYRNTSENNEPRVDFGPILSNVGILPTAQRVTIAAALLSRHQHLTADQLHGALRATGARVSRATVYNTLHLFAERGLIREIVIDSTHTYYDSNNASHHHIYNLDTGELIDAPAPVCDLVSTLELPLGTCLEGLDVVVRVRNHSE